MKICNSCMQMTGDTTDVCPVCKMHDFTPLDSKQASRERQVKKLKKSKGVYRKPRRNIRRVRYSLGSMKRNSAIRSLGTFVVGSLVLSVILNSTIWGGPGNPLDARNLLDLRWDRLGMTPLTDGFRYEVGGYLFFSNQLIDPEYHACSEAGCYLQVYIFNTSESPKEFPMGYMCLKTNKAHYAGATQFFPPDPNLELINPGVPDFEEGTLLTFLNAQVLAGWGVSEDEQPEEIYYGTCGDPSSAWFRFKVTQSVPEAETQSGA